MPAPVIIVINFGGILTDRCWISPEASIVLLWFVIVSENVSRVICKLFCAAFQNLGVASSIRQYFICSEDRMLSISVLARTPYFIHIYILSYSYCKNSVSIQFIVDTAFLCSITHFFMSYFVASQISGFSDYCESCIISIYLKVQINKAFLTLF